MCRSSNGQLHAKGTHSCSLVGLQLAHALTTATTVRSLHSQNSARILRIWPGLRCRGACPGPGQDLEPVSYACGTLLANRAPTHASCKMASISACACRLVGIWAPGDLTLSPLAPSSQVLRKQGVHQRPRPGAGLNVAHKRPQNAKPKHIPIVFAQPPLPRGWRPFVFSKAAFTGSGHFFARTLRKNRMYISLACLRSSSVCGVSAAGASSSSRLNREEPLRLRPDGVLTSSAAAWR